MNLLGLVPWGGAASGNLAVTAMLALITFVVVEVSGFRTLGPAGYMRTIFFAPAGNHGRREVPHAGHHDPGRGCWGN